MVVVALLTAALAVVLAFALVPGAGSCGGKSFLVHITLQLCFTGMPNSSPLNALPVQLSSRFLGVHFCATSTHETNFS